MALTAALPPPLGEGRGGGASAAPIRCRFAGDDAPGAPCVYALPAIDASAGSTPEDARALARQAARAALRDLLADELGCARDAIVFSDVRGQPVRAEGHEHIGLSISHERGLSLLALCMSGPVGVDLVAVDYRAGRDELQRTAAAFLPAHEVNALAQFDEREPHALAFYRAWARHEARLKCIGQPLQECSPELQARLAGLRCTAVTLPEELGANHVAALAW